MINSSQLELARGRGNRNFFHNISNRDEDFESYLTPQKSILSSRNWNFFAKTNQSGKVEK